MIGVAVLFGSTVGAGVAVVIGVGVGIGVCGGIFGACSPPVWKSTRF